MDGHIKKMENFEIGFYYALVLLLACPSYDSWRLDSWSITTISAGVFFNRKQNFTFALCSNLRKIDYVKTLASMIFYALIKIDVH